MTCHEAHSVDRSEQRPVEIQVLLRYRPVNHYFYKNKIKKIVHLPLVLTKASEGCEK